MSVPEEPGREQVEVPAPGERFPHDKHAEQKDHHVDVYRGKSCGRRNLAKEEDGDRSPEHNLPDPPGKPSHLPHGDEAKDGGKDNDRDIREGLFLKCRVMSLGMLPEEKCPACGSWGSPWGTRK